MDVYRARFHTSDVALEYIVAAKSEIEVALLIGRWDVEDYLTHVFQAEEMDVCDIDLVTDLEYKGDTPKVLYRFSDWMD